MPAFAQVLRAYRTAVEAGAGAQAESLVAWLAVSHAWPLRPNGTAGIKGDLDHFGAMGALQGLLLVLRDAGHPGLLLVADTAPDTLQRLHLVERAQRAPPASRRGRRRTLP